MSYGPVKLLVKASVTATTTYVLEDEFSNYPSQAIWESANFFVLSANTTGDWDVELQWRPGESSELAIIATTVGATAIGGNALTQIPLHANVTGINESIPMPTHLVLTEATAGGIDIDLWVMFA